MDLFLGGLDRRRGLARAIYEQLREAIGDGRLRPGDRLPTSRELAEQLAISRYTVTTAYGLLVAEGFLEGATGAGTRVALPQPEPTYPARRSGKAERGRPFANLAPLLADASPRLDLRLGVPDPSLFPAVEWRSHIRRALRESPMARYGDAAGDLQLCAVIAGWIHRSRGVRAEPDRVLVTSGAQQAFDLVLGALVEPGDTVAMEDPGYAPFRRLAQFRGAKVVALPVDAEGLVVASLPSRARLIYVTPSHQFPLGPVLSLARRRKLLDWASQTGAYVLEDDYDSEFRFAGRPLEPLARLDCDGRVIYVGSFSKTLSPSLRIGFVVASREIVSALAGLRQLVDWHSPLLIQRALAGFVRDGSMDRHLRRTRRVYAVRHELVRKWLSGPGRRLGEPMPAEAGLHVAVELRPDLDEADVIERARSRGVSVEPLSRYSLSAARRGLAIGYGAAPPSKLEEALTILADLARPGRKRSRH